MKIKYILLLWCLAVKPGNTQTAIDLRTQTKAVDFSAASYTKPVKSGIVLPVNCSTGELFFLTAVTAGRNLYLCGSSNAWTVAGSATEVPAVSGAANRILSNNGSTADWRAIGSGLALTGSSLSIDSSVVPMLGTMNTYTQPNIFQNNVVVAGANGTMDASGASLTAPVRAVTFNPSTCQGQTEMVINTTDGHTYRCNGSGNGWIQLDAGSGGGVFVTTGQTRTAPAPPAAGSVGCYFDSGSNTQVCLDASANAFTMVRAASALSSQFLTNIDAAGIQQKAQASCSLLSDAAASCATDATNANNIGSGTLAAGRLPAMTGDVTSGAGSAVTSIANGAVTEGKLATTDVTTNNASLSKHGYLPKLSGSAAQCLLGDGTWGACSNGGDFFGPATSLSGNLVSFNGNGGKTGQDSGIAAGTVVTQVGVQALSNKTLVSPSLGSSAASITIANSSTTGTTVKRLAKLTGAPSTAVIAGTADSSGIVGVVVSGGGTSGSAEIARVGTATCAFDGATTAGDYVQISSTTAGGCHDTGPGYPVSGQILGFVTESIGSAGDAKVLLRSDVQAVPQMHVINFTVDGGGATVPVGDMGDYPTAAFACTIQRVDLSAKPAGSVAIDVWKRAGGIPTAADKISGASPMGLSLSQLAQNGSISGWSTAVNVGDVFGFSVTSAVTVTKVTGQIWCR